jgi:sigma-B regulation protein RsbU (phosphoserine phosphatase)
MLFNLTNLSSETIRKQIIEQYVQKILTDNFYCGQFLTSPRILANDQHVSVGSVESSYLYLLENQLIQQNGDGIYFIPKFTNKQKQNIRKRFVESYSPLEVVKNFTKKIRSVYNPENLCRLLNKILKEIVKINETIFILKSNFSPEFKLLRLNRKNSSLKISTSDLTDIKKIDQPISILKLYQNMNNSRIFKKFYEMGMRRIYPLKGDIELLGVLLVSDKVNNVSLSEKDLNLLKILVNQLAVSLSTASFYAEAIEKRRIKEEIRIARQMQAESLPKNLPFSDEICVAAYSKPAEVVCGDFYDCISIDRECIGLVIADAAGKGLPAAMMISQIQALIKNEIKSGRNLTKIMDNINQQMYEYLPKDKFVTLLLGIFNKSSGLFEYVNAGHNFPLVVRRNGNIEELNSAGLGLSLSLHSVYQKGRVVLHKGEVLFLYTDGITEVMNSMSQPFGEDRLFNLLQDISHLDVNQITSKIVKKVEAYSLRQKQKDDQTFLVLKVS